MFPVEYFLLKYEFCPEKKAELGIIFREINCGSVSMMT